MTIWSHHCLPLLGLSALGVFGCAGDQRETERRLHELETRVKQLQSSNDRTVERVAAMENATRTQAGFAAREPSDAPRPSPGRPTLPVTRMDSPESAPQEHSAARDADDGEARPSIVGEGSRIETRSSSDAPRPSAPARSPAKPTPSSTPTSTKPGKLAP